MKEFLPEEAEQVYLDIHDCHNSVININKSEARIHGFINKHNFSDNFDTCLIKINAPDNLIIWAWGALDIENMMNDTSCNKTTVIKINNKPIFSFYKNGNLQFRGDLAHIRCSGYLVVNLTLPIIHARSKAKSPLIVSQNNVLYLEISDTSNSLPVDFWLYFKAVDKPNKRIIHINNTNVAGYITSPGFHLNLDYPWNADKVWMFHNPEGFNYMISFPFVETFRVSQAKTCFPELAMFRKRNDKWPLLWKQCGSEWIKTQLYKWKIFVLRILSFRTIWRKPARGFKAMYSLHHQNKSIVEKSPGRFDCSHHYTSEFRRHLDCNVRAECEGGEDELDQCPYYSSKCKAYPDSLFINVCSKMCGCMVS